MLFLLRLVKLVASFRASSGFGEAPEPASLPDGGASIFSTSAPMSANIIVQKAPGPTRVSSRILMPSSAPGMKLWADASTFTFSSSSSLRFSLAEQPEAGRDAEISLGFADAPCRTADLDVVEISLEAARPPALPQPYGVDSGPSE